MKQPVGEACNQHDANRSLGGNAHRVSPTDYPISLDLPSYRQRLARLAEQGIYIGTSSWKYPGWCGLLYEEQRYLTRNKFSEAKFNRTCLAEYAETYSTVCVDAGYYQFPSDRYMAELCEQVLKASISPSK